MLNMLDFEKRSLSGPVMKADEFDLLVSKKAREIVKKYSNIKFNPEELIVSDEVADGVFQAAMEFILETGVLNTDTQRVVKWTREELEELVLWYQETPACRTFGRDEEEHTIFPRSSVDSFPPVTWASCAGVIEPEWFTTYVETVAKEKCVKGFGISGGIPTVDGVSIKAGCPSEILAGLWEQRAVIDAINRAGRPNMHLGLIATVSTPGGTAALLAQGLRHPQNTMIGIHIIPEQKINWERLNLATICRELGVAPWISAMSMLGGLAGGSVGVAIAVTANFIEQLSLSRGKLGSIFISDMKGNNSNREHLWSLSAALRAIERNIGVATGMPANNTGFAFSQEEDICRTAALAIILTASGGAYNWAAGKNPEDTKIQHEVMEKTAGLSREKVNVLLNRLINKIEEMGKVGGTPLATAQAFQFPLVYDIITGEPKQEYVDGCNRAREILIDVGVL